MVLALLGLALASDPAQDDYSAGYAAGEQAALAADPKRSALLGFASGVGVAAASTTLVGPCLAAPCIVTGALAPGVITSTAGPPSLEDEVSHRYQVGYKHGYADHAGRRRVLPTVLGGLAGAALGAGGAYVGLRVIYTRLGYQDEVFPTAGE